MGPTDSMTEKAESVAVRPPSVTGLQCVPHSSEPIVLIRERFVPTPPTCKDGVLQRWWKRLRNWMGSREPDPVFQDWAVAWKLEDSGAFAAYEDQFVAVLGGHLVGHGVHPGELREAVAKVAEVDPNRVVVMAVDAGEIF